MSKTSRSLVLLALLALFAAPVHAGSVTVTWNPNPESNIVSYTVFYGTQAGVYTLSQAVGNVTTWTAANLTEGQTYYFSVEAVNADGLTSPLSREASATVPTTSGATATLSSFSASPAPPVTSNTPITWTATASCGTSPVQYKFWLLNESTGEWSVLQDYGSSDQVTWTPTTSGNYMLEVWVRRDGVTTTYEDWRSSGYFTITQDSASASPQIVSLTTDRTFPAGLGLVTRLTTVAIGGSAPLQYKFWLYSEATGTWTVLRDYDQADDVVWTPTTSGRYLVQTWVRQTGSSAPYEAWKALGWLVVQGELTIAGISPNVGMPVTKNTPITWTATAGGGSGAIEYQFWLGDLSANTWTILQPYGASNQLRWTPTTTGTYVLQVWVRTQGSSVLYEKWRNTEIFPITGTPIVVTGLQANSTFPVAAGTSVTWTATASGGAPPLQYQFWLYDLGTRTWTVIQPYSASNQVKWTPSADGTYLLQAWVRSQESAAAYEAWQATPLLRVSSNPPSVTSLVASRAFPSAVRTPVKWTATATGGSALEYQYWLNDVATGAWTVLQPYGAGNQVTWSPTAAGTYALQVWVREVGSGVAFDAWKGTGRFTIK
ncbi:MAG TPA: triple tyrosine motif-containing protein [Vicinamibacterales bacterium]